MTPTRDDAACTGAVVRKPPMKEPARGECVAVPRALIYRGLTLAAAVICEHNFCVMARTLLMVENSFCIMCACDRPGTSQQQIAGRTSAFGFPAPGLAFYDGAACSGQRALGDRR